MHKVSEKDVIDACQEQNLRQLAAWRDQQQLPDIRHFQHSWNPHEYAVLHGLHDVLQWLVHESGQPIDLTARDHFVIRSAIRFGHIELVKWLVQESGQAIDLTDKKSLAAQLAAQCGKLEILRWLVAESGQQIDVTANDNYALRWAAHDGHLGCVKWLVEESSEAMRRNPAWDGLEIPTVDVTAQDNAAFTWSALNSYNSVVQYLVKESGQFVDVTRADGVVFQELVKSKNVSLLRWLLRDAGQSQRIWPAYRDHFFQLPVAQLRDLAVRCFGLDARQLSKPELVRQLAGRQPKPVLAAVDGVLRTAPESFSETEKVFAFSSAVCEKAAEAGLLLTHEALRELLPKKVRQRVRFSRI